ncbi:hypothetical protein LZ30DRAFT_816408 [Colletotrichum cereale]|nr:hypothetical protein LZ30DRAFT_816408 [Colletotrichum cereale]
MAPSFGHQRLTECEGGSKGETDGNESSPELPSTDSSPRMLESRLGFLLRTSGLPCQCVGLPRMGSVRPSHRTAHARLPARDTCGIAWVYCPRFAILLERYVFRRQAPETCRLASGEIACFISKLDWLYGCALARSSIIVRDVVRTSPIEERQRFREESRGTWSICVLCWIRSSCLRSWGKLFAARCIDAQYGSGQPSIALDSASTVFYRLVGLTHAAVPSGLYPVRSGGVADGHLSCAREPPTREYVELHLARSTPIAADCS